MPGWSLSCNSLGCSSYAEFDEAKKSKFALRGSAGNFHLYLKYEILKYSLLTILKREIYAGRNFRKSTHSRNSAEFASIYLPKLRKK